MKIDQWLDHDVYHVWVAACLWVNVAPSPQIAEDHPAYPALQKIKGALDAGRIEILYGGHNMNGRIKRSELLKLAQLTGDRPPFLFTGRR